MPYEGETGYHPATFARVETADSALPTTSRSGPMTGPLRHRVVKRSESFSGHQARRQRSSWHHALTFRGGHLARSRILGPNVPVLVASRRCVSGVGVWVCHTFATGVRASPVPHATVNRGQRRIPSAVRRRRVIRQHKARFARSQPPVPTEQPPLPKLNTGVRFSPPALKTPGRWLFSRFGPGGWPGGVPYR